MGDLGERQRAGEGAEVIEAADRPELKLHEIDELRRFTRIAVAPRLRTIREFAEDEIVLPAGGPSARQKPRRWRQRAQAAQMTLWDRGKRATGLYSRPALRCVLLRSTVVGWRRWGSRSKLRLSSQSRDPRSLCRPHHHDDARADRFGEVGPQRNDRRQIGISEAVMPTGGSVNPEM